MGESRVVSGSRPEWMSEDAERRCSDTASPLRVDSSTQLLHTASDDEREQTTYMVQCSGRECVCVIHF